MKRSTAPTRRGRRPALFLGIGLLLSGLPAPSHLLPGRLLPAHLLSESLRAAPLPGQVAQAAPDSAPTPLPPSWVETVAVVERPGAPLAGIALAVDGGSAADRPGREGERWLLAHLLVATVEADAPSGRARIGSAEIRPDRLVLRWVVETDDVDATLTDIESALGGAAPVRTFEELRARLLTTFEFGDASPVREMEEERRALIEGFGSPWARSPIGTRVSVEGLTVDEVRSVGASLSPQDLHLAVVGAVDGAALRTRFGDVGGRRVRLSTPGSAAPAGGAPHPESAPEAFDGAHPWSTGDRIRIDRAVTNSWITVAFPVPADLPPTLTEFLAHRMREEISTTPPDPGLFDADIRVARRPSGRFIVVDVAVLPEATDRWEARILRAPQVASEPVQEAFFHFLRRRFRARALLGEAAPEAAASRIAVDLLHGVPEIRDIGTEAWGLSTDLLRRAADALGEPRILVYGPDLGDEG